MRERVLIDYRHNFVPDGMRCGREFPPCYSFIHSDIKSCFFEFSVKVLSYTLILQHGDNIGK